ncbi:MAG TPA: hypothetical protein VI796_06260 [Candidatus Thermoplasmatota archaeon]|nr:hypothetical protein [Candidatus Thermoplasmatota archaeon]
MNSKSRLLIGVAILALGVGVAALALLDRDQDVRLVQEVLADPAAHTRGTYVLVGVPQPREVPVAGDGGTRLVGNPDYVEATSVVSAWSRDGVLYHSTHTLRAEPAGGSTVWHFTNETRAAGSPDAAFPIVEATWSTPGTAFPVQGFQGSGGEPPWLWAVYDGTLKSPLQPKPSQFEGRLLSTLPDGTPLPDGALLYGVEPGGITMGCSSKFLPPEDREKYAEGQ